jgi:hypothetical protein
MSGEGGGAEPRTLEDWLVSHAFPEDLERHCRVAIEGGVGARGFELLARCLNQSRAAGWTDLDVHRMLGDAISSVTYRRDGDPLRIEDIPPGAFLTKLLHRVVLLLGDHGVAVPEYERFKELRERARAKNQARTQQEAGKTKASGNPYAMTQGKRDMDDSDLTDILF